MHLNGGYLLSKILAGTEPIEIILLLFIRPSSIAQTFLSKNLIKILKRRGFNVYKDAKSLQRKYNFIYSSNVLEHISDDIETLKNLNQCFIGCLFYLNENY